MLSLAGRARIYMRSWFLHAWETRRESRPSLPSIALLLFGVSALRAQTLDPVPGFLQDIAGQTPLRAAYSVEQEISNRYSGKLHHRKPIRLRAWAAIPTVVSL
jgi:hypothetical protein